MITLINIKLGWNPKRQDENFKDTHGTLDILSIPPATIIDRSPRDKLCAANITAFIPDAHTLLIVVASVEVGKPNSKDRAEIYLQIL